MEGGAAFVSLNNGDGYMPLPDPTDKTVAEQLNDALCTALRHYQATGNEDIKKAR